MSNPLADANGNSVAVIGRYAYAIYDEGGLLDMNVAGYPATNSTQTQFGRKGVAAYADLTQLPLDGNGTMLAQNQVDQLVGLRNYASAQPGGSYGSFAFDAAAALRYFSFVTKADPITGVPGATNGF